MPILQINAQEKYKIIDVKIHGPRTSLQKIAILRPQIFLQSHIFVNDDTITIRRIDI